MNKREEIQKAAEYCLNCKIKPCQKECPLENDIPSFIKCIKEGKNEEAYQILTKTTVLSSICGRICPHESQCQGKCVRGIKGEPVSIGELEAYIGDIALKENYSMAEIGKKEENKKKRIAVIGGGPSGLTCAAFLARKGFTVTIYEKNKQLGGILEHGIPKFRLDPEIVKRNIQKVISLGIKVEYEKVLGKDISLEELEQQYDAIFLGIGANISTKMNILGEELNGVYGGNQLLEKGNHPNYIGKKVAVIGGGNVAMDCARTIKRMGAEEVCVIYRRAEKQMPAERKEIEDAKKEGIHFEFQTNLVQIIGKEQVEEIECIKTKLIKKEGETREVPINIEGSNEKRKMDYIVMAVGAKVEEETVNCLKVKLNKWGNPMINEKYQTSKEKVFAGGDLVGTKATVAWAAVTGRKAAEEIENYLK